MSESVSRRHRTVDGFQLVGLQNERVEIWIAPELGGKWVSLRDPRTNREWMWSPPEGKGLFRAPDNNGFHTSSLVGADECIPTIAEAHWQGRDLPDHGEVWNLPWTVLGEDNNLGEVDSTPANPPANGSMPAISLVVDFPLSPLRLRRTIQLAENIVQVSYTLENLSQTDEHFVWAFHPLLWIVSGDQIELGNGVSELLLESAVGIELGTRGTPCAWPSPQPGVDLASLELGGEQRAAKFFTRPLGGQDGWAKVFNPFDGSGLTFSFDTAQVPVLGLWLNRGGWNNYHHLALEPGIGAPDPLDVAVEEWGTFGTVAAHSRKSWQFQIAVGV